MRSHRVMRRVAASAVVMLTAGAVSMAVLRAAGDRSETLIYAVYDGQDTATQAFKTMKSAQGQTGERIESYAVVGGVIGLVGGPVGVAAGATAGGAIGFLTGEAVGIPRDKVESMKQSLTPDSSALVVVLNDRWVQDVQRDLNQAHARAVIANQIASK